MKQYNSIDYFGDHWGLPVIAFDKLDGSNLRFEFSQKRGFYKFGTRKQMIDNNSEFGFAINLFLEKYSEPLSKIFKSKEYRNILSFVCYAELVGTKSAFGQHEFGNDIFDIVLFDIDQHKHGFVPPKEFVKNFGSVGIPRVVYEGNLNKEFIERVKHNEFNLTEGVICKGQTLTRKGRPELYYCKVKTNDWFSRLRKKDIKQFESECGGEWIDPDMMN
jgi:hypothetical protein